MILPAFRAEMSKLWSLRPAMAALGLSAAISVGLGLAGGYSVRTAIESDNPALMPDFTAEAAGFDAIFYGEVAIVVFAVLAVGSEFSSGLIRQSLTAVPRRGVFYLAKLSATALAALLVSVPTVLLTYLATQMGLGNHGSTVTHATVPRALLGGVTYLLLVSLLCAALTAVTRSSVLSLSILLPLFFVISPVLNGLAPTRALAAYLPDRLGLRMVATGAQVAEGLNPTVAAVVMAAWTGAALLTGLAVTRRIEV